VALAGGGGGRPLWTSGRPDSRLEAAVVPTTHRESIAGKIVQEQSMLGLIRRLLHWLLRRMMWRGVCLVAVSAKRRSRGSLTKTSTRRPGLSMTKVES
jgi:hypothetical protein